MGWWFASMIEAIQEHNGVPNECYNKCQLKSLWDCYIEYAKKTVYMPYNQSRCGNSDIISVHFPRILTPPPHPSSHPHTRALLCRC